MPEIPTEEGRRLLAEAKRNGIHVYLTWQQMDALLEAAERAEAFDSCPVPAPEQTAETWRQEYIARMVEAATERRRAGAAEAALAEAAEQNQRLQEELARQIDAADWYVRCLEDAYARIPVRGFAEAKAGYLDARAARAGDAE